MEEIVDLFVIGGGINGAGIARDAAGRGLSVVLCEKDDLGEHTSSRSGKLIHGGLRYLEYYEFRLVREALIEREVLLESAPHIIWPMRFVLPLSPTDRPAWLVRLGLFLYDHIGGRKRLPGTRHLDLKNAPEGLCLRGQFKRGFEYSDCWVDDARLVVLNALDARDKGARILTRTTCTEARRVDGLWNIRVFDKLSKLERQFRARALVNAAGPWVNDVIDKVVRSTSRRSVRMVKGSHIIVKKFWTGEHAYLVQNADKRVIFINPYEQEFALIGTTDISYEGDAADVAIDDGEIDYLLDVVNRYFEVELKGADVVSAYSGVRPLFDDNEENPSAVTRDYELEIEDDNGRAPLLSVFGGKITTFRKLSLHALKRLAKYFEDSPASRFDDDWTSTAYLPGGDIQNADRMQFLSELRGRYNFLPESLAQHYARLYGTRAYELLGEAEHIDDLGIEFGPNCFEREAEYLTDNEWAIDPVDILQRRTKHALHMNDLQIKRFNEWFSSIRTKVV